MQRSLKAEMKDFNQRVHAFEDQRSVDLNATIDIIQSLDPEGLAKYANHLQANLKGIVEAESLEEMELYKNSFNDVLDSLTINEDVLGIYPCMQHFHQVIDVSNVSLDADLKQNAENRASKKKSRLNLIDLGLKEFSRNAEELRSGLEIRLKVLIDDAESQEKIDWLRSALQKINHAEEEMLRARPLAEAMLEAESPQDYNNKRRVLAEKLRDIQRLGGAKQGGMDLQNHFIQIGRRHVDALCEARASYLPGPSNSARKAVAFGWIVAGAVLTVVGVALAAPVAMLAVGIAGITYGSMDLGKEMAERIAHQSLPILGKREEAAPKPQLSNREKAKRLGKKVLPIVLSGLALAAGIAALTFPPISIFMAVISLGLGLAGAITFGVNWYKEKKKSKAIAAKHTAVQDEFITPAMMSARSKTKLSLKEKTLPSQTKDMIPTLVQARTTEAKIDRFLLGHKFGEAVTQEDMERLKQRQDIRMKEEDDENAIKPASIEGPKMVKDDEKKLDEEEGPDKEFHSSHKN